MLSEHCKLSKKQGYGHRIPTAKYSWNVIGSFRYRLPWKLSCFVVGEASYTCHLLFFFFVKQQLSWSSCHCLSSAACLQHPWVPLLVWFSPLLTAKLKHFRTTKDKIQAVNKTKNILPVSGVALGKSEVRQAGKQRALDDVNKASEVTPQRGTWSHNSPMPMPD